MSSDHVFNYKRVLEAVERNRDDPLALRTWAIDLSECLAFHGGAIDREERGQIETLIALVGLYRMGHA